MSGSFERKYPEEHYELIEAAVFERGSTIAQAVRDAAEGKLEGQTAPFEMNYHSAEKRIRNEKRKRAGKEIRLKKQGTPEQRIEGLIDELLGQAEHRAKKLASRSRRGKEQDTDLDELRRLADSVKSIALLVRQGAKITPPTKPDEKPKPDQTANPPHSDLIRRMARDIGQAPAPTPTTANGDEAQKEGAAR